MVFVIDFIMPTVSEWNKLSLLCHSVGHLSELSLQLQETKDKELSSHSSL